MIDANPRNLEDLDTKAEKLDIITIHSAKGLEWDVVFLPLLNNGNFPSSYTLYPKYERTRLEEQEDMEESRRLFYVAVTRAREQLYMLESLSQEKYNRSDEILPRSNFILELDDTLYEKQSIEEHNTRKMVAELGIPTDSAQFQNSNIGFHYHKEYENEVQTGYIINKQKLNPKKWKYFVKRIEEIEEINIDSLDDGNSLLVNNKILFKRVPDATESYMVDGNLEHIYACESNISRSLEYCLDLFEGVFYPDVKLYSSNNFIEDKNDVVAAISNKLSIYGDDLTFSEWKTIIQQLKKYGEYINISYKSWASEYFLEINKEPVLSLRKDLINLYRRYLKQLN